MRFGFCKPKAKDIITNTFVITKVNVECQTDPLPRKIKENRLEMLGRNLNCPVLNKLLNNIIVIGDLQKDQKLFLNDDDILTVDQSLVKPISRWFNNQSRDKIVPFVVKTINVGISNKKYKDIKDFLLIATDGLENLMEVYPEKNSEINQLIRAINTHIGSFNM